MYDEETKYFITRITDAVNYLTDDEFEIFQGLTKKVDINLPRPSGLIVVSKGDNKKLFNLVKYILENFDEQKERQDAGDKTTS